MSAERNLYGTLIPSPKTRLAPGVPLPHPYLRPVLGSVLVAGALFACGGGDSSGNASTTTAGAGSGGTSPSVGGTGASTNAGTSSVAGANANGGTGGQSPGSMAGEATGGSTTGGNVPAGGSATSGSSNQGGGGAAGAGGGSGGNAGGGNASGGTGQDTCQPFGWATRSGRTGGAVAVTGGGSATPLVVKTFDDLLKYATDDQPRVIHIDGTLGSGWSGTTGDRLEIKSNKTIIGLRAGTQLKAPIHIQNASNVILRNIVIRGPGSNQDQAWDNINIEGSSKNIWVDHAEFWDGQDGNADVVKGADNVTFSWTIFGYTTNGGHNLSNLIGSSDSEPVSEGKLNITYMFNWWKGAAERQPRCRYGQVHVGNNLYTGNPGGAVSDLGVSNGFECSVLTENNHFIDQAVPIDLGKQAGTGSVQEAPGNLFENCTGNQKGSGKAFTPPYEYKSFLLPAAKVKDMVQKNAGATLASPTACSK